MPLVNGRWVNRDRLEREQERSALQAVPALGEDSTTTEVVVTKTRQRRTKAEIAADTAAQVAAYEADAAAAEAAAAEAEAAATEAEAAAAEASAGTPSLADLVALASGDDEDAEPS